MEDMYERAEFAKEIGSIIIMMDLTVGFTAMTSMSQLGPRERDAAAPPPRRPRHLHAPEDPRRVVPGASPSGAGCSASTTSTPAPWSASSRATRHDPRLLRRAAVERFNRANPADRHLLRPGLGARCRASCRSPRAASTPARCTSCCTTSARTSCCSSAAARSATRWASPPAPPPTASRVEAMIKARNEGRDYFAEGPDILVDGGQGLPRARRGARGLEGHHASTTSRPTRRTSSSPRRLS